MLPLVSIVIPTYNSEKKLRKCLESVYQQEYPKEKIEVIIVDGGSDDGTLQVAEEYNVDVCMNNPLRTGEAGKALGLRKARHELVCFIDSDNILPSRRWLSEMVSAFEDPEVVGAEPVSWTYQRKARLVNRYAALNGDPDPAGSYIGTRAHFSWSRLNWHDCSAVSVVRNAKRYVVFKLLENGCRFPSIGANGFIARTKILQIVEGHKAYYFDIDVPYDLFNEEINTFAKVKIGITHLHAESVKQFIRKNLRRARDYKTYREFRSSPAWTLSSTDVLRFLLSTLLIFPLLLEVRRGYKNMPDPAWFFHPIACWLELVVYALIYLYY